MNPAPKTALCLTGGGVTGGLYQVGALAALEDFVDGISFDIVFGASSGATVASTLAGGVGVRRMYRALLDPADNFFPLERGHMLSLDLDEWRRTFSSAGFALRRGLASLIARTPAPAPADLWEQLDRFYDALPAGLFTLDRFETFLSDFFLRRGIPNSFRALNRELLVSASDLDSGELALFGAPGLDHVPVSLACAASMALPLFYSPVRVGGRYYVDGTVGRFDAIDTVVQRGARLVVIVNPNVPVRTVASAVPSGHGTASSLRDKGMMWVYNQAVRSGSHARLHDAVERARGRDDLELLLIEPDPSDAVRFLQNAASFTARREILQWAYRSTRERVRRWVNERRDHIEPFGWRPAAGSSNVSSIPPPSAGD